MNSFALNRKNQLGILPLIPALPVAAQAAPAGERAGEKSKETELG